MQCLFGQTQGRCRHLEDAPAVLHWRVALVEVLKMYDHRVRIERAWDKVVALVTFFDVGKSVIVGHVTWQSYCPC